MKDRIAPPGKPVKSRDTEKAERLALALRENLRRRKAQNRGRDMLADDARAGGAGDRAKGTD